MGKFGIPYVNELTARSSISNFNLMGAMHRFVPKFDRIFKFNFCNGTT